jgi:hypothetical protein
MIWLLACTGGVEPVDRPGATDDSAEPVVEPAFSTAARADLRLKRWRQLSLDLQGALALTPDQVCKETGLYDCTDLHAVALGGLSRDNGVYDAQNRVGVTTSLAMERVVLQACWTRVELDLADTPVVFTHVALDSSDATETELDAQTTELTRRLLARDPVDDELIAMRDFHATTLELGGTNAEWAWGACFALGTSTEALLY